MDALSPGAGQPAAVARRGPLRRLGSWYRRHVWVATALLIVVLAVAGFVALQALTWDKVGDGVTVAGVELGGLSDAAAAAAVTSQVEPKVGTVRLDVGDDEPLTLTLAQLGITLDADATAAAAMDAGRRELPLGLSCGCRVAPRRWRRSCASTRPPTRRASRPSAPRSTSRPRTRASSSSASVSASCRLGGAAVGVARTARGRRGGARARHPGGRRRRAGLRRPGPDQGRRARGEHRRRRGARLGRGPVPRAAGHAALPRQGGRAHAGADGRHALGQQGRRRRRVPAHLPQRARRRGAPPHSSPSRRRRRWTPRSRSTTTARSTSPRASRGWSSTCRCSWTSSTTPPPAAACAPSSWRSPRRSPS